MESTHPRVKTAHVTIRYTAAVDDVVLDHLVPPRRRLRFVDPLGLEPMVMRDEAKLDRARDDVRDARLELVREWLLVEERPRVLELAVELVLELAHAADRAVDVAVPREHENRRVCAALERRGVRACRGRAHGPANGDVGARNGVLFVAPWYLRSDIRERGRFAVAFMGEAEDRMQCKLRAGGGRQGRCMLQDDGSALTTMTSTRIRYRAAVCILTSSGALEGGEDECGRWA